jgi:hypothetical protein
MTLIISRARGSVHTLLLLAQKPPLSSVVEQYNNLSQLNLNLPVDIINFRQQLKFVGTLSNADFLKKLLERLPESLHEQRLCTQAKTRPVQKQPIAWLLRRALSGLICRVYAEFRHSERQARVSETRSV